MKRYRKAYVEVTNLCNLNCSFCLQPVRENSFIAVEKFKEVANEVSILADEICPHIFGEPLLHPNIEEIVNYCGEIKLPINLTTNGLLIKRSSEFLLRSISLRQINFSLQAISDNFAADKLNKFLIDILNFVKVASDTREDLYINFRLWNIGKDSSTNEYFIKEIERFFNLSIKRSVDVGGIKSKKIVGKVYLHFDSRFEWPSINSPILGSKGKCHGLGNHFGILVNGDVVPCCLDKDGNAVLGNCHKEKLADILNSSLANEMCQGFKNGKLVHDLCKRCSYIQRFSKN